MELVVAECGTQRKNSRLEPNKEDNVVNREKTRSLRFYFEAYMHALCGEPNFLEMEIAEIV